MGQSQPILTATEAIKAARTNLATYSALLWPPFKLPRHLRLLISELEHVEQGETDRLIITCPPRHGKSVITSTLYPSWFLGRNPTQSVIASSYSQELSSDWGRKVRELISDPLHRAVFPKSVIAEDNASIHRLGLNAGGSYFAVGGGGSVTGRGADMFICDDMIKGRNEAMSATERRNLQVWFESVAYTRLQPQGRIVVIGTRWHENDLIGWLLREHAEDGWRLVSLPAVAEPGDALGREEGAALWPERFGLAALDRIRIAIGSQAWLAEYCCRPVAEGGNIFKRSDFMTYPWRREKVESLQVILSIDSAFKKTETADYSVIQAWAETKTGYYLLDQWRARADFSELLGRAIAMGEYFSPHYVLVEDAASGQSLIQMLMKETRLPILPVKPLGDKQARAHAVSPLVESGRVFIPDQAPWREQFLDELTSFPSAPFDDCVDAATQALAYLREHAFERPIMITARGTAPWHRSQDVNDPAYRLYARGEDVDAAEDGGLGAIQASSSGIRLITNPRWRGIDRL
jgi:predicted phage terminase large subunit-like protein